MRPVIIKNDQIHNTLWPVKIGLWFLCAASVLMYFQLGGGALLMFPLILLFIWLNNSSLSKNMVKCLRVSGQNIWVEIASIDESQTSFEKFEVQSYWYLPWALFLKLKSVEKSENIYLYLLRSKIKNSNFSKLLSNVVSLSEAGDAS